MDETSKKPEASEGTIELPAPTEAPIVCAFGVALTFAGLVTHGMVTAIGALLSLYGLVAWFKQVLPHSAHERVAPAVDVLAVSTSRPEVERVNVAANLVRANLPIEFYPVSAGVMGGLAGGVAMAVLAVLYGVVSGHGIWYPINLLAAGFFPSVSIAEISSFHLSFFGIALLIHAITSLLVGVLYGAMLPMLPRRPILLGGVIAPLLWTGLLYSSLALINPLLAAQVDWWWFALSQFGFGLVAGLVVSRRQRVATAQPLPFSMRAGLEATGFADDKGQEHD